MCYYKIITFKKEMKITPSHWFLLTTLFCCCYFVWFDWKKAFFSLNFKWLHTEWTMVVWFETRFFIQKKAKNFYLFLSIIDWKITISNNFDDFNNILKRQTIYGIILLTLPFLWNSWILLPPSPHIKSRGEEENTEKQKQKHKNFTFQKLKISHLQDKKKTWFKYWATSLYHFQQETSISRLLRLLNLSKHCMIPRKRLCSNSWCWWIIKMRL